MSHLKASWNFGVQEKFDDAPIPQISLEYSFSQIWHFLPLKNTKMGLEFSWEKIGKEGKGNRVLMFFLSFCTFGAFI